MSALAITRINRDREALASDLLEQSPFSGLTSIMVRVPSV